MEQSTLVPPVEREVSVQEDVAKHGEKDERKKSDYKNVQIENVHHLEELSWEL